MVLAKERGAKRALPLPVSAPFHSSLMAPAAKRLADCLQEIPVGSFFCPVVSNVEAAPYHEAERVKSLLVDQVCAPVRWDESVLKMQELGVLRYVEIGPGKVLSGLVKRIAKGAEALNVEDSESFKNF
jgi:[acyl-carrier-protein] S-malonyltransferase